MKLDTPLDFLIALDDWGVIAIYLSRQEEIAHLILRPGFCSTAFPPELKESLKRYMPWLKTKLKYLPKHMEADV
jgi:hypothetical protein